MRADIELNVGLQKKCKKREHPRTFVVIHSFAPKMFPHTRVPRKQAREPSSQGERGTTRVLGFKPGSTHG